jgi:hypothetical protein
MRRLLAVVGGALAGLLLTASGAASQSASLVNATLSSRSLSGPLEKELPSLVTASADTRWIAWSVPAIEAGRDACCGFARDGAVARCGCTLEDSHGAPAASSGPASAARVDLESGARLIVLLRVEGRAIRKVASYTESCQLDAGGRPVLWLNGVNPADSVATLARLAAGAGADALPDGHASQPSDGALAALAMHADAAADAAILALIGGDHPLQLRKQAVFWLGQSRDPRALAYFDEILTRLP